MDDGSGRARGVEGAGRSWAGRVLVGVGVTGLLRRYFEAARAAVIAMSGMIYDNDGRDALDDSVVDVRVLDGQTNSVRRNRFSSTLL